MSKHPCAAHLKIAHEHGATYYLRRMIGRHLHTIIVSVNERDLRSRRRWVAIKLRSARQAMREARERAAKEHA